MNLAIRRSANRAIVRSGEKHEDEDADIARDSRVADLRMFGLRVVDVALADCFCSRS